MNVNIGYLQQNKNVKIPNAIGLVSIVLLSMFVIPFSAPLLAPVVITFDTSEEVQLATSTLQKTFNNIVVYSYEQAISDLFIMQKLMRSRAEIILIGHGTPEGIQLLQGTLLAWQNLATWVNSLPSSKVILLACNSATTTSYLLKQSLGFSNAVDGIIGALIASIELFIARNNLEAAEKTLNEIIIRIGQLIAGEKLLPLGLGPEENKVHTVKLTCSILSLLLPLTGLIVYGSIAPMIALYLVMGLAVDFFSASYGLSLAIQSGDLGQIICKVGIFFWALISFVWFIIARMPWWTQIGASCAAGADTASFPARTTVIAFQIIASLAFLIYEAILYHDDYNDLDDYPRY